jgi:iron complex transport system ATP-binding protein
MNVLCIEGLCCGYEKRAILSNISFEFTAGKTLCLLGPNGAGKTTLFKTMLGLLSPLGGRILYNGEDTSSWTRRRFAQTFAYIPQDHTPAFPFTAFEVVLMGRTPQLGAFSSIGTRDEEVARKVMEQLGIEQLAERDYTRLSGGERQMVLVARALAQQPVFLVMDEPTASLDFGNQARVLERIRALASGAAGTAGFAGASGVLGASGASDVVGASGAADDASPSGSFGSMGVIMTTHDPNQALLLGGQVACMGRDGSFAVGEAQETITPDLLRNLYGTQVKRIPLMAPVIGGV